MAKTVIITGASAGIGLSVAQTIDNEDFNVYAASRSGNFSKGNLKFPENFFPLKMDVNDAESVKVATQKILDERGTIDAVVCNAGNGIAGAVEDMTLDEVRYQMETNFFGTVRVIQELLPIFRRQHFGKIIVTASVAGVVPIPFQSVYSASKAAIMIFVDALALELKPYNVQCCCVLPGDTKTNFTAARVLSEKAKSGASPYTARFEKSIAKMAKDEQNGVLPQAVAKIIVNQLHKKRMKSRVVVGWDYKLICWAFGVLPARLKMWIVGLLYA
jgi:short-subunit dehydrogenase